MEFLGKKLKWLRTQQGLTQQAVAQKVGISRSSYAYYEVGKTHPLFLTLLKLARFFQVRVEYLIDDNLWVDGRPMDAVEL